MNSRTSLVICPDFTARDLSGFRTAQKGAGGFAAVISMAEARITSQRSLSPDGSPRSSSQIGPWPHATDRRQDERSAGRHCRSMPEQSSHDLKAEAARNEMGCVGVSVVVSPV